MDEPQPITESTDPPSGPSTSRPAKVRRWRRWLAAVFLLLIALLVFLPTLLGSAVGRPLLLGYVNQQLNGRVEVRDCSLGWFHGMNIDGLVIFDASDRQILQGSHVTSGLRFLDLLEGNFRFHQIRTNDLDLLLSRGPEGSLNWEHLIRADSTWKTAAARKPVTGELFVSNGSATYEDQTGRPPVFLRSMTAYINLPPRGSTVIAKLGATAQIGTQTSGQVLWDGSIRPVANGSPDVSEQLITHGLDPAVVLQRLGPSWTLLVKSDHEGRFVLRRGGPFAATGASEPGPPNDLVGSPPTR